MMELLEIFLQNENSGYKEALSGPFSFGLTVFTPTNAAFEDSIIDTNNLDALDVDVVTALILYHIVIGFYRLGNSATDGLTLPTLEGDYIDVGVIGDVVTVGADEEIVVGTNILANNGIIHKIDGVLFPASFFPTEAPTSSAAAPVAALTFVAAATLVVTLVASM